MTQSHEPGGDGGRRAGAGFGPARRDDAPPLGRWETLGAWLRVWTPPRGAEVPPVPWRRIGIAGAVLVVVCGAAAAVLVPRISTANRERATHDAAARAASRAAERARVVAEQRPHRGRAERPAAADPAARERVLAAAQADVLADARARVRTGTLKTPVHELTCSAVERDTTSPVPHPETDPSIPRAAYDCVAVTDRIAAGERNAAGLLGYPFRLKVDFRRGTYVWCKQNPTPGEMVVPDPRDVVPLPRACRL
jgi:hypothetical protein